MLKGNVMTRSAVSEQEYTEFFQISQSAPGEYAHFEENQSQHTLKWCHKKTFDRVHGSLPAQNSDHQRTDQQQHSSTQNRISPCMPHPTVGQ